MINKGLKFLKDSNGYMGSSLEVVLIAVVVAIAATTLINSVVTGTSAGETLIQVLVPLMAWIGAVVVSVRQFMMEPQSKKTKETSKTTEEKIKTWYEYKEKEFGNKDVDNTEVVKTNEVSKFKKVIYSIVGIETKKGKGEN